MLPKNTKVVVIGGGIAGCSCAYHLAKFGWKDVILLERDQLTSGTTWHAAGLVSQLGPTAAITKIRKYTTDLYKQLEKKIDFSAGLKLNGALSIATTKGRWQELKRQATTAQLFDVNVEVLNINQIKKIYPVINEKDILGGIFMPGDGQADPIGVTNLLAKAAKQLGVKIFEATKANKIEPGKSIRINTDDGCIQAETLVLAGNAYIGGLNKKLRRMIMPASSCIIATEPMSAERSNDVIPSDMAVCDLNTILDYYRLSPDKRMLFGGRFNYSGIEPSPDKIRTEIRKRMIKVFPDLDDLAIDYAWSGNVAVTINRIPQLGRLSENIYYSQGYSGHGVAPTHMAAKIISSGILKEWDMIDTLSKVKHIQLPGGKWFSSPAMSIGMAYYRLKDFLASKS